MRKTLTLGILAVLSMLLLACQTASPSRTPEVQTVVVTVTVEQEDQIVTEIIPATPTPQPQRSLTICVVQEPENLFIYGNDSGKSKNNILNAIYDGPIDTLSYSHVHIILEDLPSFQNGDVRSESVTVNPGDPIVNSSGMVTTLSPGVQFYPAGCNDQDCMATYLEGQTRITMNQMEVTFTLLPGLLWSDGTPLRASDSVYSFELASASELPTEKQVIDRTSSYRAVDGQTVRWTGLPGYKDANFASNFWTPLPEHLWRNFYCKRFAQRLRPNAHPHRLGCLPDRRMDTWRPNPLE
ncbi:MAG: hypothetical protein HC806_02850 [Anaerolineae bacterium]|nr:hypothetical protein [Anaerolineae bacterium]